MRVIKMYTWEKPFAILVGQSREYVSDKLIAQFRYVSVKLLSKFR
jgi:hypothetical protein